MTKWLSNRGAICDPMGQRLYGSQICQMQYVPMCIRRNEYWSGVDLLLYHWQ